MTDLSRKSCVVLDHGMFVEVAHRLSRDFGKVYYVNPCHEECMPKIDNAVVGDGFDNIERISEIWEVIEKVDLCVFPDVHHGYMQQHIESMGIPVWGGRRADELELKKVLFRAIQRQMGMHTPQYEVIIGLDDLRRFCENPDNDDRWIKMSPQYRGNRETFHHKNLSCSREILDAMGVDFGPVQEVVKFIAEHPVEAEFESGVDSYCVLGQHPASVLQAYERKDQCCVGAVQDYHELPAPMREISERIWPLLEKYRARQFVSTEVKIDKKHRPYLLEPTVRCASPAGEPQLEMIDNFSQIIYSGAAEDAIEEPKWAGKYYVQVMIEHTGDPKHWRGLKIPDSIRRWVKLYHACQIKDTIAVGPMHEIIGSLVGIGSTIGEAMDHANEIADALHDQPVTIRMEDLADTLAQIIEAQESGLKFSQQPIPQPEEAIDPG